jgi:hypothetical protein
MMDAMRKLLLGTTLTLAIAFVSPASAMPAGLSVAACRREFRPPASELPPRFLLVVDAALYRLIDGESGGCGNVQLAVPGDIELWHSVSHRHNQLRTQYDHRD